MDTKTNPATSARAAYHLRRARDLAKRLRSSVANLTPQQQANLASRVLHHTDRARELS